MNNLSTSILQTSDSPLSSSIISSSTGDSSGFFDSFKSINLTTWLIIFLILAFLGFNIFVYLAKGTQDITNIFTPLFNNIFGITLAATGETIDVAAQGAKAVVGGTAKAIDAGLTAVQDITPNSTLKSQPVQGEKETPINNTLNKALQTSHPKQNDDYQALEASSSLHNGGKSGWCFIGEDRGFRSCSQVGENDKCMSGDIFPSQELCINPNLRA